MAQLNHNRWLIFNYLPNEFNMEISRDTSEYGFIERKSKSEVLPSPADSPT